MELLPLAHAAQRIMGILRGRGYDVREVCAPLEKRYFVYMLGRGVPPPNNNTFRWCTRQIKVDPMQAELRRIVGEAGGDVLMLTGVRQGESAMRDGRIAMSCGRDGAECGQGWYQEMRGEHLATLAPILHWRVCHVWDWLMYRAPDDSGLPTRIIADAYGGDEAVEINARTGCVGCPLANQDTALDVVLRNPKWEYLAPLKGLRPLYRELREPCNRLRKGGGERRQDGTLVKNQYRMGPLTLEARKMALDRVLDIQDEINEAAERLGRPEIDLINFEERMAIENMIMDGVWPQKWTGREKRADEPYEEIFEDGSCQRNWLQDLIDADCDEESY
jgi:DNA sulfur modification protein DndC